MAKVVPWTPDCIDALKNRDKDLWDRLKKTSNASNKGNITGVTFENLDLSNYDFVEILFQNCTFKNCDFSESDIRQTKFMQCKFLNHCNFSHCKSGPINNREATRFIGEHLEGAIMVNMNAEETVFIDMTFAKCNLTGSNFKKCSFNGVSFLNTNLSGCNFQWAKFSNNILWQGTKFDRKTDFYNAKFETNYDLDNDKSDKIKFSWNDYPPWNLVHFLSTIPIFQASFVVFTIALLIANIVVTVNESQYVLAILDYPIPMPRQIMVVLSSSFFLFLGSLFYRWGCPKVVQDFTESEWVYEHNRARPRYRQMVLQNTWRRILCFSCLIYGGGLAFWLLSCRVLDVVLGLSHGCLWCH